MTGQIYNKKRPRLAPKRMEDLSIINLNYDVVQEFTKSNRLKPAAYVTKYIVLDVNEVDADSHFDEDLDSLDDAALSESDSEDECDDAYP